MNRPSPLVSLLAEAAGLDAEASGMGHVERIARRLMACTGILDLETFCDRLRQSPVDLAQLLEQVVVPETWFFRDGAPFALLADRVRHRTQTGESGPVRVLSVPCATGEEPYSIAVTLALAGVSPTAMRIDAADISRQVLAIARQSIFSPRSFRGGEPEAAGTWFRVLADGRRQVEPDLARQVHFHQANLARPGFMAGSDPYPFVFCRNLIIYLNPEARRVVLGNLRRVLSPGGVLFVGHAEMPFFTQNGYRAVDHPQAFACVAAPPATDPPADRRRKPVRPAMVFRPAGPNPAPHRRPDSGPDHGEGTPSGEPPVRLDEIRALADRGELEQAAQRCEPLLRRRPPPAEVFTLMGLIRLAQDRLDEAAGLFERAIYLAPDDEESLTHLALLAERRGERDRAARLIERVRRNRPVGPAGEEA